MNDSLERDRNELDSCVLSPETEYFRQSWKGSRCEFSRPLILIQQHRSHSFDWCQGTNVRHSGENRRLATNNAQVNFRGAAARNQSSAQSHPQDLRWRAHEQ
jgi:hypothetical protein